MYIYICIWVYMVKYVYVCRVYVICPERFQGAPKELVLSFQWKLLMKNPVQLLSFPHPQKTNRIQSTNLPNLYLLLDIDLSIQHNTSMFTIVVHVFVFYAYNGQKKTCGFSGDGSEVEAHGTGVLAEARALVAQLG